MHRIATLSAQHCDVDVTCLPPDPRLMVVATAIGDFPGIDIPSVLPVRPSAAPVIFHDLSTAAFGTERSIQ